MREFAGGRLNTTAPAHGRGKMMMPTTKTNKECKAESGKCFVAGDIRASEQPALAAMHTIFLREHNRMVDEMARVSQHWNKNMSYGQGSAQLTTSFCNIATEGWTISGSA